MFYVLEAFNDSSWKYNFVILMTIIFVGCGIFTFVKIYLQRKKEEKEIITSDAKDEYTQAVLDNEDIIIKRKKDN